MFVIIDDGVRWRSLRMVAGAAQSLAARITVHFVDV